MSLPVMSDRSWRKEKNPDVSNLVQGIITKGVLFHDGLVIRVGALVTSKTGEKGIIVELDDAGVLDDFIRIWWPDKGDQMTWHTLDHLRIRMRS